MDYPKCQTATATPAKPGDLPLPLDNRPFLRAIEAAATPGLGHNSKRRK
jgi:hypothetical protein